MNSEKILGIGFASCAVLLLAVSQSAAQPTQPVSYLWDGTSSPATTFWDTAGNWNVNGTGSVGGFNNNVPDAFNQESGLLTNALLVTPYTVNVRLLQDFFPSPTTPPAGHGRSAAGVVVGVNATLTPLPVPVTATLNIQTGASLKIDTTYGPNGALGTPTAPLPPSAGTGSVQVNDTGAITIQPGGLLTVQDNIVVNGGNLTVLPGVGANPGGQAAAENINSNARGSIILSGNAVLNSTFSSTLNGTTTITGPLVTFNASQVVLNASSVFNPEITHATNHSVLNVTDSVTLGGTLRPKFTGVTPTLNATWPLWDSKSTFGSFAGTDDSLTDLPDGHRYAVYTTTVGSVHGTKGLLTVENFLTAEVNRANGQVTLKNTAATGGVTMDGYEITSASGALKPSGFTSSLDDDGFDGNEWTEAGVNANSVGELNLASNSLIATSSSNPLGSIYDPIPTVERFGDIPPEDLVFTYHRSDGRLATGAVTYINDGLSNTLVLQVDPVDGKARIINDSNFDGIQIDGYRVRSAAGKLKTTWNSLDDQNVGGATWQEALPTTNVLSELNPTSTMTVNHGVTAAVMTGLYDTAGSVRDLTFEFRAASPTVGAATGDYNNNGIVDAADYTVWRNMLGQAVELPNDDDTQTPNSVTQEDYVVWKTNFGSTGGTSLGDFEVLTGVVRYASFSLGSGSIASVPEPSTFMLLGLGGLAALIGRRRK
jgi:hypothetical protein